MPFPSLSVKLYISRLQPTYIDFLSGEFKGNILLAAIQEEFATLSGNMAKIISEAFKSVKADLEISYDEEIQGEDILTKRASPCEVEAGRG